MFREVMDGTKNGKDTPQTGQVDLLHAVRTEIYGVPGQVLEQMAAQLSTDARAPRMGGPLIGRNENGNVTFIEVGRGALLYSSSPGSEPPAEKRSI